MLGVRLISIATIAATSSAMEWPDDIQSVASWPTLQDGRPVLQAGHLSQPSSHAPALAELQRLKGGGRRSALRHISSAKVVRNVAVATYAAIGLGFAVLLSITLWDQPLFPFRLKSVDWCRSWLVTTVADYYGASLCLCGVIVASEKHWQAALWVSGCCLLGTPVCCAYVISRLLRHHTLQLAQCA